VEEKVTKDGEHVRREVHEGPGFKQVKIVKEGGSAPPPGIVKQGMPPLPSMFGGGGPDSLIQAIMQDMMSDMGGGSGTVRISGGPMGG